MSSQLKLHVYSLLLMFGAAIVVLIVWIAVQATRSDPLPTLLWSPRLTDAQVMEHSPQVLDRLGNGWWWIYARPQDRARLSQAGASIVLAMPTPVAQMAGCSMTAVDLKGSAP